MKRKKHNLTIGGEEKERKTYNKIINYCIINTQKSKYTTYAPKSKA